MTISCTGILDYINALEDENAALKAEAASWDALLVGLQDAEGALREQLAVRGRLVRRMNWGSEWDDDGEWMCPRADDLSSDERTELRQILRGEG